MEEILDELGFVGKIAVGKAAPWLSASAQFTRNFQYDPPAVTVDATEGARRIQTQLDARYFESIIGLPPYARNWKAYEEFQRQVRSLQPTTSHAPVSTWFAH
jgi:hypothetical protein